MSDVFCVCERVRRLFLLMFRFFFPFFAFTRHIIYKCRLKIVVRSSLVLYLYATLFVLSLQSNPRLFCSVFPWVYFSLCNCTCLSKWIIVMLKLIYIKKTTQIMHIENGKKRRNRPPDEKCPPNQYWIWWECHFEIENYGSSFC